MPTCALHLSRRAAALVIVPEISYPRRAVDRAKLAKQWEEEERAFEQEHAVKASAFATPWQLVTATCVRMMSTTAAG